MAWMYFCRTWNRRTSEPSGFYDHFRIRKRWVYVGNSIIYPLANVVRTLAFILMAMLLNVSGGSFTLPYVVFIVIDIIGAGLIMLIPYKKA